MKLYTELEIRSLLNDLMMLECSVDDAIDSLKPIELPSDEEIDEECRKLPYEKHLDDGQYNDGQMAGFELGAYWMRQQILNQNK